MQYDNDSFQLAALHLGFLQKMHSEKDLKQNLTTLPKSLTLTYDQIYDAILAQEGSAPQIALNAFRWIQCSNEPLASETLLDAVTVEVDSDSGEFCQTGPSTVEQLLTVCQNFVILDETLNVFRFAHLSVDEYLDSKTAKLDAHTELSKICLSLLCSHSAWTNYDQGSKTYQGGYEKRHLLLYSAEFWPWHLARCEDFNRSPILSTLWGKLSKGSIYEQWCDYHRACVVAYSWRGSEFWQRHEAIQNGGYGRLLCVCIFGLYRGCLSILPSGANLDTEMLAEVQKSISLASRFGEVEVARLLIQRGADVSTADENGNTPLHIASEYGNQEVARLLIEQGADISAATKDGAAPLHNASQNGHQEVTRLLVERGADVSPATKDGTTPLHLASLNGYQDVARLLIDRGVDVSGATADGTTPLHIASLYGHEEAARLLVERKADVSAATKDGTTPLHYASWRGYQEVARLLVERGADVSAATKDGTTPLHYASRNGYQEVARLLIERGADVSAATIDGTTPLHYASRYGYQEVARLLVERGADVSAATKDGTTPLHDASQNGYQEVAKLLVERGADVSTATEDETTPIHLASRNGHQEVATLLVERDANLSTADKRPEIPLDLARGNELARLQIATEGLRVQSLRAPPLLARKA